MKSLALPTRDAVADLDLSILRKRQPAKGRLQAHREAILTLFDNYTDRGAWNFERADALDHLPEEVRRDLLTTYKFTYPNGPLRDLRTELLSIRENLCPYCQLEPPSTLDHFLPKSRHQPFASFAPNLIPMCKTCNTLKGTKGSSKALQFFTHAYFDEILDGEKFVIAQVAVGAQHIATNFAIDFSADIDASIFQRLAYQFSVLRLTSRFQLASVDVIYNQASKLEWMEVEGCDEEDRRKSLEGDANTEAKQFGSNYWKAALLAALADNRAFYSEGFRRALS